MLNWHNLCMAHVCCKPWALLPAWDLSPDCSPKSFAWLETCREFLCISWWPLGYSHSRTGIQTWNLPSNAASHTLCKRHKQANKRMFVVNIYLKILLPYINYTYSYIKNDILKQLCALKLSLRTIWYIILNYRALNLT